LAGRRRRKDFRKLLAAQGIEALNHREVAWGIEQCGSLRGSEDGFTRHVQS
jgi:hypothetical protein